MWWYTQNGAGDQGRTDNLRITIPLLCQIELRRLPAEYEADCFWLIADL